MVTISKAISDPPVLPKLHLSRSDNMLSLAHFVNRSLRKVRCYGLVERSVGQLVQMESSNHAGSAFRDEQVIILQVLSRFYRVLSVSYAREVSVNALFEYRIFEKSLCNRNLLDIACA